MTRSTWRPVGLIPSLRAPVIYCKRRERVGRHGRERRLRGILLLPGATIRADVLLIAHTQ